jgi:hypothetical protein
MVKKIEKEMKGVDLNAHALVILMLEKAIHYFHIPGTIGVQVHMHSFDCHCAI